MKDSERFRGQIKELRMKSSFWDNASFPDVVISILEVALQLAIMNERNAARDDQAVSDILAKVGLDEKGDPK